MPPLVLYLCITTTYYIVKVHTTNSIMAVIEDVIDCADTWVDMLR